MFSSKEAFAQALDALQTEEGCDFTDCVFERASLNLDGLELRVREIGSFPASFWDITTFVLAYLGESASSGAICCTYDSGEGVPLVEWVGPDRPLPQPETL